MMKTIRNWFRLMGQKKNNKGAALIIVIVSVALIGIMVAIILSTAFINYKMKLTDLQAKNNFYTAESALDEIKAGLEEDTSVAMSKAYELAMKSYTSTMDDNRQEVFQTEFVRCLRERIGGGSANAQTYNLHYLESYLDKTSYDEDKHIGATLSKTTQNTIKVTTKGFTICNLVINYVNVKNFESEIKTDIVLNFPVIDFYKLADTPSILNYSLIANRKFLATGVVSNIKGNAYIGKEGALLNNSTISFDNMNQSSVKELLVTKGVLQAENGSKLSIQNKELWAGTLLTDASTTDINGDSYVSNDLIVNNTVGVDDSKPNVKVQLKGNYYGYGSVRTARSAESLTGQSTDISSNPANYSSAIVVNGAKSTVDLTGLDKMMIAGNSYIAASRADQLYASPSEKPTGISNQDIPMGESISIKSNQSAYLIPAECIAPEAAGGGKNPMTASQYRALQDEIEEKGMDFVDLKQTKAKDFGSNLQDLGVTGYQVVSYPVSKLGSMVYVFMKFDNEQSANNFFTKYYAIGKNLSKLKEYLNLYTDAIKIPGNMDTNSSENTFYYNGNIVVNENSRDYFYLNRLQSVTAEEQKQLATDQVSLQNKFYTLNKTLTKEYSALTDEQKKADADIFSNLMKTFTSADSNKNISGSKTFVTLGEHPLAAVLVNGNYTIDSQTVTGKNQQGENKQASLCVVIATGNVTVKKDFAGLIIAKGDIILDKDYVNISANSADVSLALKATDSNGIKPLDYLVSAQDYTIGGIGLVDPDKDNGSIKLGDLITYENWTKQ